MGVKHQLQNGALLIATLLVCIATFEIGLRIAWDGYYPKFHAGRPMGYVQFHEIRGWANIPNVSVRHGSEEFTITYTHDERGFRRSPDSERDPDGRTRILILGDSMTHGTGVEDDETYSARLEALDPRLAVTNAGVPGYSGVQQLLLLRDEGLSIEPEVVVLGFLWNDLADAYESKYARFEINGGELRFVPGEPASPDHPAFARINRRYQRNAERYDSPLTRSYSYRFVSDRIKLVRWAILEWLGDPDPMGINLEGAELESAWALSLALVGEMRRLAEEHGARFLLLAIPDQLQVEPESARVMGAPQYLYDVPARLAAFAEAEGFAFLDLAPHLQAAAERSEGSLYYRYDRHMNPRGHAAVAEALHAELDRLDWL